MFIKKKITDIQDLFLLCHGLPSKTREAVLQLGIRKGLVEGIRNILKCMYLLQEIRSFLHEHGEQSKDQGCLLFCSPRPLYSASQPKSMFFLRATCQYCSGCVKPFLLLHLHAASSSPSNVTAINPHGFPYKITWQKLFSPDHPYY